ncbi:hypothetical protein ACGF5C_27285 [Micromonospora sp. NPDC047620]|uniref:hypothetical protein n=1 Tax=Micromonospora sp. NPDC047620 TaxID=3364251 RepID=UPI0037214FD7
MWNEPDYPTPDTGSMVLIAACIRCLATVFCDPDTVPSVWINYWTRCSLRPDGSDIEPGEPSTTREPLCSDCASVHKSAVGRYLPVRVLFPHARLDRITVTP